MGAIVAFKLIEISKYEDRPFYIVKNTKMIKYKNKNRRLRGGCKKLDIKMTSTVYYMTYTYTFFKI